MKNKKFLGILMALGLTFSLTLAASAKYDYKYGSIAYSVDGSDSKENKTDVNDMLCFYITIKKMLDGNGLLDEQMKTQILNKITMGDRKEQKLKLPITMGGRESDRENIGQAIEFCVENEKELKKLQEAVKKTDFKNIEITKDDFNKAKEEVLKKYNESIKNLKNRIPKSEDKLKLSDIDLLKNSIEQDLKELDSINDAETKARYNEETIKAIKDHIKKFENYIKELESKKEKSKELERELKDLKESTKRYISFGNEGLNRLNSYLKDLSELKFEKVKESKNKFKFKNEITNIKDGDFYTR